MCPSAVRVNETRFVVSSEVMEMAIAITGLAILE
jgi:hypothetical protein